MIEVAGDGPVVEAAGNLLPELLRDELAATVPGALRPEGAKSLLTGGVDS